MDDDLFQFEPAKEVVPELVLGKKKKKKKKKDLELPTLDDTKTEEPIPDLDLGKGKKKQKNKDSGANGHGTLESLDDGDEDNAQASSSKEPSSAFATLSLDDGGDGVNEDEIIPIDVTKKKKKKKKKKGPILDELVENTGNLDMDIEFTTPNYDTSMNMDVDEGKELEMKRPMTAAQKKKAKKERDRLAKIEKKKDDDDDLDAILAELDGPSHKKKDEDIDPSAPIDDPLSEVKPMLTAAQKKRLSRKKKKALAGEEPEPVDEVDAILGELSAPPKESEEQSGLAAKGSGDGADDLLAELGGGNDNVAGSKSKKKKKKKKGGASESAAADVDALLAELGGDDNQSKAVEATTASQPSPVGGGGADDLLAELGVGGDTEAPAAGKKKAKKKKKKGGAKTEEPEGAEEGAITATTSAAEGGKKKKKESATVRRMREAQEKRLAEEERIRKEKEEEEARIAEEEKKREEEIARKAEEKARKKAAEKAKKERKRQEGTLLSKAEREKRRKAEAFKRQLIEKGMIPAALKKPEDKVANQKKEDVKKSTQTSPKEKEQKGIVEGSSAKPEIGPEATPTEKKKEEAPAPPVEVVPDDWDADENGEDEGGEEKTEPTQKDKTVEVASKSLDKKSVNSKDDSKDKEKDEHDSDEESDDDDDTDDDSDYEGMSKAEIATEKRIDAFRKMRSKQKQVALASRTEDKLRSPIICILGHVDTGKTKILDKIRRTNVQDGEAGGITQQIGATYFPIDAVKKEATKLEEGRKLDYNVPSLLIIDTPGHESFTNLRSRGSSLCDIAILVVDIMHGLEPQTRESIDLLKLRKTPFIVALNKIDRIYDWNAQPHNCPSRDSIDKQPNHAREEFYRRVKETKLQFAEIGFNTELYWENTDVRRYVSLVPTSAITGEGIPDLLMLLLSLPQRLLTERLMFKSILEATVLEVKVIEGLGTTIDIILTGGTIREGDTIVVVGLEGPLVATIRALLTPHPMKEMRVKGQYLHHKQIEAAQGVKISADGLEKAVAGTQVMVVEDPTNEDEMDYALDEVMQDFQTILKNVDKSGLGVYVQASTLGSLEALLEFLRTSKIPVSGINIGPVHKRDVTKASTMIERRKEFATILAFDVPVEREAKDLAEDAGVRIFTADIIYHLFEQFTKYMEEVKKLRREQVNDDVVFPSISRILPQHVYNKKDPIVVGVDVLEGILRVGTPLVVKKKDTWLDVGRVASLELNKKQVITARKGESVALKIQGKSTENVMYGRHFDFQDVLVSKMSRHAIDLLKESFKGDLETEDWRLVVKLKKMFNIL